MVVGARPGHSCQAVGAEVIRIGIVEDHPVFRQGLAQTVEASPRLELTVAARSIEDWDEARPEAPAVVLLDLNLPGMGGAEGVRHVCEQGYVVLVISAVGTRSHVVDAIAAGASGYLTKNVESDEIVDAIETVASGGTYISPTLAAYLLETAQRRDGPANLRLSEREREVLALVAQGERDQDIAEQLFISIRTVRSHLDRIRDKTGRRRRPDLTRLAVEEGIVSPGDSGPAERD